MLDKTAVDRCRSFIDCQLRGGGESKAGSDLESPPPVITISRQTGSGGLAIAQKLAEFLRSREPVATCPWTVFDKNLVEKVLEEHHLPQRMAQFLSEDRVSAIDDMVEEVLGLHPPSWTLVHQTTETILHLAELGYVILVGRGANVITNRRERSFHVRLVGSLDRRVKRVMERHKLDRAAARRFVQKEDRGRARYLRKYFDQDIDNPLLYHLVINTDWFDLEDAARLIGETVLARMQPAKR
jgi:cytidylate kinase